MITVQVIVIVVVIIVCVIIVVVTVIIVQVIVVVVTKRSVNAESKSWEESYVHPKLSSVSVTFMKCNWLDFSGPSYGLLPSQNASS